MTILSEAQQKVVNGFIDGYNLQIEAVAGAGKTTTLLALAETSLKANYGKVLILTYNRSLCDDVISKIKGKPLEKHCFPYTYHKYAKEIYKTRVSNDQELYHCLQQQPKKQSNYGIILVDEVQDMKHEYYKLLSTILHRNSVLVLVGDRRQCIYGTATAEYLVNYKKYFDTGRPWMEIKMNTSYRTTPANACFVNTHLIGEELVISGNSRSENILPIYYYNVWDIGSLVRKMVEYYGHNQVAITAPSTKPSRNPKTPLGKLIGEYREGLLFYVKDSSNQEKADDKTLNNKVLITTFHSMKGLERDCVIVLGFDSSYMKYYDKGSPRYDPNLPNILYVAATRARQQLILVQSGNCLPLATINKELLTETCDVRGKPGEVKEDTAEVVVIRSVLDTISYLPTLKVISLLEMVGVKTITHAETPAQYKKVIKFGNYYENVSNYYGILIPLYFQYRLTGSINYKFVSHIRPEFCDIATKYNALFRTKYKSFQEWMELVVLKFAQEQNRHFCADQIRNYEWVDIKYILTCFERLLNVVPKNGIFERGCMGVPLQTSEEQEICNDKMLKFYWKESDSEFDECTLRQERDVNYNFFSKEAPKFHGIFDYITDDEIWEFKCTSDLSDHNKLQLATYLALYYKETGKLLEGHLFNSRTNEHLLITLDDPDMFLSTMFDGE